MPALRSGPSIRWQLQVLCQLCNVRLARMVQSDPTYDTSPRTQLMRGLLLKPVAHDDQL